MLKSLMRELVLHATHDRFARLSCMVGILHDIWRKLRMEDCHLLDNLEVFGTKDTPRCYRELHHRHEGMHLCGTHDKGLVKLVGIDTEEGCPLSAANHIWANIGITEQASCSHTWDKGLHCLPAIVLIAKALYERLTTHLPASTVLIEWELQANLCPRGGVIYCSGSRVKSTDGGRGVAVVVTRIKLVTIYAIVGLHLLKDIDKMC